MVGKAADVGDDRVELFTRLGVAGHVQRRRLLVRQLVGLRQRASKEVHAAVVGDPIQPRLQRHRAVIGEQRAMGSQEDVLNHVFGLVAAAQDPPGVRDQPLAIASDDPS